MPQQLHLEAQNPHGDAVLERLVVRVYRARNLRAADANGLSDPYVTVRLANKLDH
jgi:Ca2+-dependent lipid-binding protein